MTCLRCGKVIEFESHLLEKLKTTVSTECSFSVVIARLEIGGYCQSCRT
jgi:Fur family ferric uptake transcriptional regulator